MQATRPGNPGAPRDLSMGQMIVPAKTLLSVDFMQICPHNYNLSLEIEK